MKFTDTEIVQVIPEEDHSYKGRRLRQSIEEIQDKDDEFYSLINNVIVGEDQKGKIMDQMSAVAFMRKLNEQKLYMSLALKTIKVIGNYSERVEDNKRQKVVLAYNQSAKVN
jgi:hypothetical protein